MNRNNNRLATLVLVLLVSWALLAACGDNPTATTVPISKTTAPGKTSSGSNSSQTTRPSGGGGIPTPVVGPDGQITVVAPPANLGNFKGTFYFVKNNNIWQGGTNLPGVPPLSTKSLGGVQLTKVSALSLTQSPALSPDGLTLAYAYSPDPVVNEQGRPIIGQDIMAIDLKTKTNKVLVAREEPEIYLDNPAWSADGKFLYASYRSPLRDKTGAVIGQKLGIERVELATGKREYLVEDAREPAPSADGKFLVYVGVAASKQTFDYSFNIMNLATKEIKPLTTGDQNFLGYYAPRVSPNNDWIVFAAPGGPDFPGMQSGNGGGLQVGLTPSPKTGLEGQGSVQAFGLYSAPRPALAHGLPYDLWLIKPDGTGLRRLTTLFEDQPVSVWSKDGQQVIFLAGQGFYSIDVNTGALSKKSDEGSHFGFDYQE